MKTFKSLVAELNTASIRNDPKDTGKISRKRYAADINRASIKTGDVAAEAGQVTKKSTQQPKNGDRSTVNQGTSKLKDQSGFKGQTPKRRGGQRQGDLSVRSKITSFGPTKVSESYGAVNTVPHHYDTSAYSSQDEFDPKVHHVYSSTKKHPTHKQTAFFHATDMAHALTVNPFRYDGGKTEIKKHHSSSKEHKEYVAHRKLGAAARKSLDVQAVKELVRRHGIKHNGKPLNPDAIHEETK